MSYMVCKIEGMNSNHLSVAGPYTHENLSIFLLRGTDAFDGSRFIPLDEAMEQKAVIVHETGNVGELEIENLSDLLDLYVQAGDVVKGGRQDRTLGVDFVLPAKSGRVPVQSFCVESGRWHRRAAEAAGSFSSSKSYLASKKLRLAAKLSKSQGEVWQSVAETQKCLTRNHGFNDAVLHKNLVTNGNVIHRPHYTIAKSPFSPVPGGHTLRFLATLPVGRRAPDIQLSRSHGAFNPPSGL
jgi:hypothetical protein